MTQGFKNIEWIEPKGYNYIKINFGLAKIKKYKKILKKKFTKGIFLMMFLGARGMSTQKYT